MSNGRNHDQELDELFKKAQDEQSHLKTENTFHTKRRERDVMVHIAVTVLNEQDGRIVAGEKEHELGQFAVRIPSKWFQRGLTGAQAKKMFEQLSARAYERMRVSGLTRE